MRFWKRKKQTPKTPEKKVFKITGDESANKILLGSHSLSGNNRIEFRKNSRDNLVHIGENTSFNNIRIAFHGNNNRVIIGEDVRWSGYILVHGKNRTVTIGDRSTAQGVYILSRDEDVSIGSGCMLSREIEIRASDVHKIYDLDTGERLNKPGPVKIGNDIWIAAKAFVSKGASIPNGCIVGATSFVNKPFDEENVIIAGSPAKIVKRNIRWER
ncbi:acyltransferase [Halomonas litopenaei]|uniref:acyltransferase n=1 Tax=Halomonas litopenaei TaxID=2109328 RepID=UPI003FA10CED